MSPMNDPPGKDPDRQLQLLRGLLEDNGAVECDVLKIGTDTWAIHGVIPVDGEVLMAEYDSYEAARHALDEVLGEREGQPTSARRPRRD
jgi:hypothetical protein